MHETIGLLGGSFNPIHLGHLAMAEAAQRELALDRLLIIPDGDPPHKSFELAGKRHRLRMTELAANGRFAVSAMEVERPGKTYTVDTLEVLHSLYPEAELWMIIGADTLREISGWRNAPRVFALCRFAVFARDGLPLCDVPGARVTRMQAAIPDLSATEIRARVHRGQSLAGYVPQAVEDYIGARRLYDPPVQMGEKALRKRLRDTLPQGRLRHTLGVAETMAHLAGRWGYADLARVAQTGLLHDCAKGMDLAQMLAFVDAQGMPIDEARRTSVALAHGIAGAAMARAIYGVTDPEVLRAIRDHNTGGYPVGTLGKMLWVADMMEPSRKERPWLPTFRALAMRDLDAAARQTLQIKLDLAAQRGFFVHPDTRVALDAMQKDATDEMEGNA